MYNLIFLFIFLATLHPYPTVNVTRYNSQSFNCSVDPDWNSVTYNYDKTNVALFNVQGDKCKNHALTPPGLYTTNCDDSTRTFYLTINNVTGDYNGKIIECIVGPSTGDTTDRQTLINVQCK
jgi:hypothetical protein